MKDIFEIMDDFELKDYDIEISESDIDELEVQRIKNLLKYKISSHKASLHPNQHTQKRLKSNRAAVAAVAASAIIATGVFAASKSGIFDEIFHENSKYIQDSSLELGQSAVCNGIKVTLLGIAGDKNNAYMVIDIQNEDSSRFIGNHMSFGKLDIDFRNSPLMFLSELLKFKGATESSSSMGWHMMNYDENGNVKAARFFISTSKNTQISGCKGVLRINDIIEEYLPASEQYILSALDMSGFFTENPGMVSQKTVSNSDEIYWDKKNSKGSDDETERIAAIPGRKLSRKGLDVTPFKDLPDLKIDNMGFVDGKLHIITRASDTKNSITPRLEKKQVSANPESAKIIEPEYNIVETRSEESFSYGYYVYDIGSPEQLRNYSISGWFAKKLKINKGVWEIPFDADYSPQFKKIRLSRSISIDSKKFTVESAVLTPISLKLEIKGPGEIPTDIDFKILGENSTNIEFSLSSGEAYRNVRSFTMLFCEPVDMDKINAIIIDGEKINIR